MAATTVRLNTLPIIYTSGTYYEVGFDVGKTFRSLIEDYLTATKERHSALLAQFSSGEGKVAYDTTLTTLQENYPHYLRELQGTADGARVPFYHLMVLHMNGRRLSRATGSGNVTVDEDLSPPRSDSGGGVFGCTSISLNLEDQVLLGHTEDAEGELLNHIYLVSAHVREEEGHGRWGTKEEHFTALAYAGYLPGFCMGFNHHGLVYSINVINPRYVLPGNTPREFLCRALLSAETLDSLHAILRDEGVGAADGFSVNVAMMAQDGSHVFQNLEVGTTGGGARHSAFSVTVLNTGDHLFHTNKYLHLSIPMAEELGVHESSNHREARASVCPPPVTRRLLLNLLSDTHDPVYPVFRTNMNCLTTALGLFDMLKRTWTFWIRNPKTDDPLFSLPITFKWDH